MANQEAEAEKREQALAALHQKTGLFAFQNGVPHDRIPEFVRMTAAGQALLTEGAEPAVVELAYLQKAIELIAEEDRKPEDFRRHFHFEEDAEVHGGLLGLPAADRIVFVLSYFHGMDPLKFGRFSGWTQEDTAVRLTQARSRLIEELALEQDTDLEERLRLLAKSYSRLSFHSLGEEAEPAEAAFSEEDADAAGPVSAPPSRRMPKKTVALLAAAFIGIGGIVGSSFFFGDEPDSGTAMEDPENYVSDEQIEEWKAQYSEIRERGPAALGLAAERYGQLEYVKLADAAYERFFSDPALEDLRQNPEEMEKQAADLMMLIETPGGMSDFRYVDLLTKEEQAQFINSYAMKTQELMNIVNYLFFQYHMELSKAESNGQLSVDKLMLNLDEYPGEVAAILEKKYEAGLRVEVHPNRPSFLAKRDLQPLWTIPRLTTDWSQSIYLEILMEAPHLDGTGLLITKDMLAMQLTYMEMLLVEEMMEPQILEELEVWFEQLFWFALKSPTLAGEEEQLTEARKYLWDLLLARSQDPMYYILHPIVNEMEASDWKKSAALDELAYGDITDALEMKKSGELAALLPFADRKTDGQFVDVFSFDWDSMTPLYEKYSEEYDESALMESAPIEIYMLYHFANRMEDPETMWHLLEDDAARPSREQFISEWKRLPDIQEKIRWLELHKGSTQRSADQLMVMPEASFIDIADNQGLGGRGPALVTDEDGPWKLKHQWSEYIGEGDELTVYQEQVRSMYEAIRSSGNLKVIQAANPTLVGGVYLYATTQRDAETIHLLLADAGSSAGYSKEEIEDQLLSYTTFSFDELRTITFQSEAFYMEKDIVRGALWVSSNIGQEYFGMIKTEEGWRMDVGYW